MKKNIFRTLIIILIIITIPFPAFADYGTIEIDGYNDDWEDKPHTEVYPGKNPPQSKINYVSLFRDESNVYVHVEFAYENNQDITNMNINLYTNLGNESYFIVPDYFYYPDDMDSSELDMAPDQSNEINTLEQESNTEEEIGAESDQTTNTGEDAAKDLLSNSDKETYFVVADNENKEEKKTEEATQDSAAEEENVTDTTDLNTNNDQGNGTDTTDQNTDSDADNGTDLTEETDIEPGDLLDLFDPNNIVDLDNVLDLFETDTTSETNTDADLDGQDTNMDGQNSNLNLKKPGWYGTWSFNVYKDRHGHDAVGSGYYTRTEGEPDELELYIPLSSVTHQYDGITEISMKIKKLGPQYIMCVGASSGPYIGVAIGAGIAMLSVGAYSYKKKRPFMLNKGR